MPETKQRYLETHRRDICRGCRFWVPLYRDKRNKLVYGCQIGESPYKGECSSRKDKSGRKPKYG